MTALNPYPKYKDSGVEWLADVPGHWLLEPLGKLFTERKVTVSDANYAPLSVTRDGIVPQLDNVAKTENGEGRKLVMAGDFAINSRSDRKGSSGLADRDGSVSVITTVIIPRRMNPYYAHHLLRSVPFQEEYYRYGSGIVADLWSTRWSAMKGIRLAVPSPAEQSAIATFLDRETAQIDAFIADQEELIGLLAERQSATIIHAVTKGLDPTAPIKDSGVEWLGMVPAHWRVSGFRRFCSSSSGAGFPHEHQGDPTNPYPFYKVNALARADSKGVIRFVEDTITFDTAAKLNAKIFAAGTVVLAKIGAALLLGRIRTLAVPACIDNNMLAISPGRSVDPEYLAFNLQSVKFEVLLNPGAVPSMSDSKLMAYPLAWPNLAEQKQIVAHVREETAELDAAITDARTAIALSRERRSALISAAVTGKIDVREAA